MRDFTHYNQHRCKTPLDLLAQVSVFMHSTPTSLLSHVLGPTASIALTAQP
jgi:hypothetical protein